MGFLISTAVVVAILGWQAVESQEVKGSLKGGLEAPVDIPAEAGEKLGVAARWVNEGDRTLTLEGAELVGPTAAVELLDIVVARRPGNPETVKLDGFQVRPGDAVVIVALIRATSAGKVGFDNLRLHYRAGGRAGQTAG
jgi:hypothetical protein